MIGSCVRNVVDLIHSCLLTYLIHTYSCEIPLWMSRRHWSRRCQSGKKVFAVSTR